MADIDKTDKELIESALEKLTEEEINAISDSNYKQGKYAAKSMIRDLVVKVIMEKACAAFQASDNSKANLLRDLANQMSTVIKEFPV